MVDLLRIAILRTIVASSLRLGWNYRWLAGWDRIGLPHILYRVFYWPKLGRDFLGAGAATTRILVLVIPSGIRYNIPVCSIEVLPRSPKEASWLNSDSDDYALPQYIWQLKNTGLQPWVVKMTLRKEIRRHSGTSRVLIQLLPHMRPDSAAPCGSVSSTIFKDSCVYATLSKDRWLGLKTSGWKTSRR